MYKYLSKDGLKTFLENLAAKWVKYDNSQSGLGSTTVQGAVDEVNRNTNIKSVSLESIGMGGSNSLEEICTAMPNGSRLEFLVGASDYASGLSPTQYGGVITIVRITELRTAIQCQGVYIRNELFVAFWRSGSGVSDWAKLATA